MTTPYIEPNNVMLQRWIKEESRDLFSKPEWSSAQIVQRKAEQLPDCSWTENSRPPSTGFVYRVLESGIGQPDCATTLQVDKLNLRNRHEGGEQTLITPFWGCNCCRDSNRCYIRLPLASSITLPLCISSRYRNWWCTVLNRHKLSHTSLLLLTVLSFIRLPVEEQINLHIVITIWICIQLPTRNCNTA